MGEGAGAREGLTVVLSRTSARERNPMYITQALKRAVQIHRNGIATIDGTRQRTWAEFAERVAKLAGVLQGLDLSAGGRVAILALNSDRYLEYFFAVPWAGGIVVPFS
jgi:long-chain acyl-CoA synthetase